MSNPADNHGSPGKTESLPDEEQAQPSLEKPFSGKKKCHSLYGQLLERNRLRDAFKRVKSNGGASGSDGVSVAEFEKRLEEELTEIICELRAKTYQPRPIRRVEIPKRDGGKRRLGIPAIRDRVVQDNLRDILEKIFEPKFSDHSHGFRPQKGCFTALRDLFLQIRSGGTFIVDVDIEKCFDTIPHEPLIDAVAEEVADGSVLNLIRVILKAPIDEGYRYVKPKAGITVPDRELGVPSEGTAQGSPVSPLLANIYLAKLDEELAKDGIVFCRYADDIRATTQKWNKAREVKAKIDKGLESMGLKMNVKKTKLTRASLGVNFLGYRLILFKGKLYPVIPRDRVARFKEKVRALTRRNSHLSKDDRVKALGNYVSGWGEYFKRAKQPKLFDHLDRWIYRRLIAMYAGRWRSWLIGKYPVKHFREAGVESLFRMHKEHFNGPWVPLPLFRWATSSRSA